MEILKRWKLECPLLKRDAYLTFFITEATTFNSSKREGIIRLLQKCSLCTEAGLNVCSTCPKAAELTGLPVNLE